MSDLIYAAHLEHFDRKNAIIMLVIYSILTKWLKYLFYYQKILNGENINSQKPRLANVDNKKFWDFYWD